MNPPSFSFFTASFQIHDEQNRAVGGEGESRHESEHLKGNGPRAPAPRRRYAAADCSGEAQHFMVSIRDPKVHGKFRSRS